MTSSIKVSFYILETTSGQKSLHFACGLIEKMYVEQNDIYIHTPSQKEAEHMDALLWTYRDDSFLPHHLYDSTNPDPAKILIGFNEPPAHSHSILINLAREVPFFYKQFNQVIEIVFAGPSVQQLARERYKHYRDQACEMTTYKLKANEL